MSAVLLHSILIFPLFPYNINCKFKFHGDKNGKILNVLRVI